MLRGKMHALNPQNADFLKDLPMNPSKLRCPKTKYVGIVRIFLALALSVGAMLGVIGLVLFRHQRLPIFHASVISSVQNKIEQAQTSARLGSPQTVQLSEDDVNSMLRARLQQAASPPPGSLAIRDVRVHLIQDRIRAYIVLGYHGSEITVDIEGKLHSRQGLIQFDPIAAKIGALNIPQSVMLGAIQQLEESPDKRGRLRLTGNLSDLRVEGSQVVLVYN